MKSLKEGKYVGLIGILANLFLFVIKIIVGIFSNSQALIADSFNSIGDVFASFMTLIGKKIANNNPDNDHNFGHDKAEYIFSMFISISIFIVALKILYESVISLFNSHEVIYSYHLILVTLITIFIKFLLYLYTKYLYKKQNSILIKSNNIDHRNDMILTSSVLISIIFSKYNIYFVDSVVGITISLWFLISGIKIFKESYDILMDIALPIELQSEIIKLILKQENILDVLDMYSISVGYKYIMVLTLCVDGNLTTFESHDIASSTEKIIKKKYKDIKEVFIHIHPIDTTYENNY